jgi:hypothetical protein
MEKLLNTLEVIEWNKAVSTQIYTTMPAHCFSHLNFNKSFCSTNVPKLDMAHILQKPAIKALP